MTAGWPSRNPASRSGKLAARTALSPTTWAGLPTYTSPPCARPTGTPHPITRSKPSPVAGNDRHHGRATAWAAPGPAQLA